MEEEKKEVEIKKELSEETPSVESNVTTESNVQVKTELNDVNSGSDVHPKAEPNNETSSDSNNVKSTTDLDDKIIRQVEVNKFNHKFFQFFLLFTVLFS